MAVNKIRNSAKSSNMSFKDYSKIKNKLLIMPINKIHFFFSNLISFNLFYLVFRGHDPCVNVVLTEDAAAVASVGIAATCMGLSTFTGSPIPDAVGSLLVGSVLGGVASFIIYTNVAALVGR